MWEEGSSVITFDVDSILDLLYYPFFKKLQLLPWCFQHGWHWHFVVKRVILLDLSSQDIIDKTARSAGKRALCMGGAKNHLIAMPDCDEAGLQEYQHKNQLGSS